MRYPPARTRRSRTRPAWALAAVVVTGALVAGATTAAAQPNDLEPADLELANVSISSVSPSPLDGCGAGTITVTGAGFLGAGGTPAFNTAVIAAGNDDVQELTIIDVAATQATLTVPESSRPLRTSGGRVLALIQADGGNIDVLSIAPVTISECAPSGPGGLPARMLDTRTGGSTVDGQFAGGPRPGAGTTVRVAVDGRAELDPSTSAFVLSVAAVQPSAPGFLTVWSCDGTRPPTSNVNYGVGGATANSVVTPAGADGDICVYTSAATDLILDVTGELAADSPLRTIAPARVADTRGQGGTPSTGGIIPVPIPGRGGVPDDARLAILTVTIVGPATSGFASVFPCSPGPITPPNASNINFTAGQTVANLVVSGVGSEGLVCVLVSTGADVLVDVSGSSASDPGVVPLSPARLFDSRDAEVQRVPAGGVVTIDVAGRGGVPADATDVVVNLTSVEADDAGFATVWDCSQPRPNASNLNYSGGPGVATGAAAFTALGASGRICVYTSAATDLLVDVTAAFR